MEREKGENLLQLIDDYTVIDLETTGTNIYTCDIIEMSAVKVRNNEIVDEFSTLISIAGTLPSKITSLTGITDEMLVGQPPIEAALTEYIGFLGNDTIVGHNISSFDLNILYDSLLKIAGAKLSNDFIDTLRFAKHCDIECGNLKLSTICDYFHIENNQAHRSLSDCIANHYCYQKLKELYRGRNVHTKL